MYIYNDSTNTSKASNQFSPGIIKHKGTDLWFMESNATFNNVSFILWRSVLLMEETGVPGENHRPVASHCQTLSRNDASSPPVMTFSNGNPGPGLEKAQTCGRIKSVNGNLF
jgi:hypothetical protein